MKNETFDHLQAPINLTPGARQNVRQAQYVPYYGELIRNVTKTEWKREKSGVWFYWYWTPETCPNLPNGFDCGFSGILIEKAQS